jgi:hypothetical protein
MEESRQRAQSNPRMRLGWMYSRGSSRDSRSSMYKMNMNIMLQLIWNKRLGCFEYLYICAHAWLFVSLAVCVIRCSCLIFILCSVYNSLSCLIVYFLCRLKINHDSHEFILEFGTVVNNTADIPGFLCEWQVSWQTCRFGRQVLWNHWLYVCVLSVAECSEITLSIFGLPDVECV